MADIEFVYELNLPTADYVIDKFGFGEGGEVQRFIDSEVIRLSDPYVPFQRGDLRNSALQYTHIGSGVVTYNTPYAHFQWVGRVMRWPTGTGTTYAPLGEHKVYSTIPGRSQLTYRGAPMRGKEWVRRMIEDGGREKLMQGIRAITTRRS